MLASPACNDILPVFKVMGEDESQGIGNLSLVDLSLHDDGEASNFLLLQAVDSS